MGALLPPPNYPLSPGTTGMFLVSAVQADGVTPFPLANCTVTWAGKLDPSSTITLWSKAIGADVVIVSPSTLGQIQLYNRPADTTGLNPGTTIFNRVVVTDQSGDVYDVQEFITLLTY